MEIFEMEVIVDSKGRFVVPSKILEQLGIKDKAFFRIEVDIRTRQLILTPLCGMYKGKGLMKALMNEKMYEIEY